MELEALEEEAEKFSALGASLAAVSPQAVVFNREMHEEKSLTFELLSDPGNKTCASYGLKFQMPVELQKVYSQFSLDIPAHNGDDSWTLPLSARFIVDKGGIIRYSEIQTDYTIRPNPEHTLEKLRSLGGQGTK